MGSTTETDTPSVELEVIDDWTPFILADATPEFEDSEQATRDIVMQILQAEDVDAVLEGANVTPARDLLGVPLRINGAKAKKSAYEDGATMYVLIDAVNLATGEMVKISCGARNVMAQLFRTYQLNGFPLDCRILESERPTAEGFRPLWLKR